MRCHRTPIEAATSKTKRDRLRCLMMSDTDTIAEAPLRVACVQMCPTVGEKASNLTKSEEMIRAASEAGARPIVLPELANSGYMFQTREEAFDLSEPVANGETCQLWSSLANSLGVTIVAGICEQEESALCNSAVTIGPNGHIGTYRKVHLWDHEALFVEPGNLGFPVLTTDMGRIASFICYDCWFAEAYRCCALKGADILCVPTGWPIGGPASKDREEIICADINLSDARKKRTWNEFNHILRDRRPEVYGQETAEPRVRS